MKVKIPMLLNFPKLGWLYDMAFLMLVLKSYSSSPIWTLVPPSISPSGLSSTLKKHLLAIISSNVLCNDGSFTTFSDDWVSGGGRVVNTTSGVFFPESVFYILLLIFQ